MFYKHVLLHGLNICAALRGAGWASSRRFRLYWVLLNAAYVLEFFLQTLVRRRALTQRRMLQMNGLLMLASTLPALSVLRGVDGWVAAASAALNYGRRGHDVSNTVGLLAVAAALLQGRL